MHWSKVAPNRVRIQEREARENGFFGFSSVNNRPKHAQKRNSDKRNLCLNSSKSDEIRSAATSAKVDARRRSQNAPRTHPKSQATPKSHATTRLARRIHTCSPAPPRPRKTPWRLRTPASPPQRLRAPAKPPGASAHPHDYAPPHQNISTLNSESRIA